MVIARKITAHEKRVVGARSRWHCESCHEILDATFEVDHIVPLHAGGEDTIQNCQSLCVACHKKKTLAEEMERVQRVRRVSATGRRTHPLVCVGCKRIVSPFFRHACLSACPTVARTPP